VRGEKREKKIPESEERNEYRNAATVRTKERKRNENERDKTQRERNETHINEQRTQKEYKEKKKKKNPEKAGENENLSIYICRETRKIHPETRDPGKGAEEKSMER